MSIFRFLKASRLYILVAPVLFILLGAGMNQAVLVANHDKFPVMVNQQKADVFIFEQIQAGVVLYPGMLDDTHCLMTKETHLNFLADYIDLKDAIYSPGDLTLMLGEWTGEYSFFAWSLLMLSDAYRRSHVEI